MASDSSSRSTSLQLYALLFLVLGGALGAVLGARVGAADDGVGYASLTTVPQTNDGSRAFNWLFFEIGLGAGMVCCSTLLAASVVARCLETRPTTLPPPAPFDGLPGTLP